MTAVHFECPACGAKFEWDEQYGMRLINRGKRCPQCVETIAMELEEGMMELVAQGKAVIVGKTKDGRNRYELVSG